MFKIEQNMKVYRTLEDFVSDTSQKYSPNVQLKYIENLFFYYAAFLLLFSFVLFIDRNLVETFLLNYLKTINRLLIRWWTMIAQKLVFGRSLFRRRSKARGNRIAVDIEST